ncbi:MAG: HAD family hydrolase [Oscillospiraceae bacterium]|jgi:FMN phosphatase YigB (HAD superfamily)|nr:HAD family hydrolase [Oscillospiraceae bacterium]
MKSDCLKTVSTVVFDYFDTLVYRDCTALDIKRISALEVSKTCDYAVSGAYLLQLRLSAEEYLSSKRQSGEFSIEELACEMACRLVSAGYALPADFASTLVAVEMATELAHQVPNDEVIAFLKQAVAQSKAVYVLSDFYMPKPCFLQFLEHHKLAQYVNDVFVSCDLHCSKANGDIYPQFLREIGVSAADCLMLGDNYRSDVLQAKRNGLQAIQVKRNAKSAKNLQAAAQSALQSVLAGKYRSVEAMSNYAFPLYLMCEKMYQYLCKSGKRTIHFLSREGEFLKKLFETYCALQEDTRFDCRYLFVSRLSTFAASLRPLAQEDFQRLFKSYPKMSLRAFLTNCSISKADIQTLEAELALDFDCSVPNLQASSEFSTLLHCATFQTIYTETTARYKQNLTDYLLQEGVGDGAVLVDVGWKGSMQDNLFYAFDEALSLEGIYLGTVSHGAIANNKKTGMLFSKVPIKSKNYDAWTFDKNFYERLLSASHSPTVSYRREASGEVVPVFTEYESEKSMYNRIAPIQAQILEKFSRISEVLRRNGMLLADFEPLVLDTQLRLALLTGKKKLKFKKALLNEQFENFGYIMSSKEHLSGAFSLRNILKNMFRLKHLQRVMGIVSTVFSHHKLYTPAALVSAVQYRIIRRQIQ